MDQHQSRKVEIDGREESFNGVIKMGEELLAKNHYASDEVSGVFLTYGFFSHKQFALELALICTGKMIIIFLF